MWKLIYSGYKGIRPKEVNSEVYILEAQRFFTHETNHDPPRLSSRWSYAAESHGICTWNTRSSHPARTFCTMGRMSGDRVLWLPGTDHAGIATQMVVERQLAAEGIRREDLGREKFVEKVWEWKNHSGGTIQQQMRILGESVDWTRERFTLDEGLSAAVRESSTLYDEGLIYAEII